jgi:biopolymer transport protein ExbD
MKFAANHHRGSLNRTALNLSSMIDVTFLLLIYFIVTTVFALPEDMLSPSLKVESNTSSQELDYEPQIVTLKMEQSRPVYVLGEHVIQGREEFSSVITKLPLAPGLVIRVESEVPVGFAVAAIQDSKNVGFHGVTYVPAFD